MNCKPYKAHSPQNFVLKKAKHFWLDERGAVAIEYGLISALISILLISSFSALGEGLSDTFNHISDALAGPPEMPFTNSKVPPG